MLVVGLIFLAMWIAFLIMGSRIDEAQLGRRQDPDGHGGADQHEDPDGHGGAEGRVDRVGE